MIKEKLYKQQRQVKPKSLAVAKSGVEMLAKTRCKKAVATHGCASQRQEPAGCL